MSYRPICDVWILGRPKVPYYGSFPCGFLQRARDLLGVHPLDPVLHVCSGMVRAYGDPANGVVPGRSVAGFGINDRTLDIDPECKPDFLQDAREPFPDLPFIDGQRRGTIVNGETVFHWPAILIDRPYTEEDATHYRCGSDVFPAMGVLLKNATEAVRPGGRIGVLDYLFPRPPATLRLVAKISVNHGYNNRDRCYTVFEKEMP